MKKGGKEFLKTRTEKYFSWIQLQAQEIFVLDQGQESFCPGYKNKKLFVLNKRRGNNICPEEEEN